MRRFLSMLLTVAMCIGMVPAVFAATDTTAEAAGAETMDLLFVVGQSNAAGFIQNVYDNNSGEYTRARQQAVAPSSSQVYSTYVPLDVGSSKYITGLYSSSSTNATASNMTDYIPNAVGSSTSMSGKTLEYKPNALSTSGTGKAGMDGAIAYKWNQLTGNMTWITNLAVGSTHMYEWIPGSTYFEATKAAMKDIVDIVNSDSNYEIGNIVMFWLQGESDTFTAVDTYVSEFSSFVDDFTASFSDLNIGIIMPRSMSSDGYSISSVFQSSNSRIGLQQVADAYSNVYIASDVNLTWNTDTAVKNYWADKYPSGINYPLHDSSITLSLPTTQSDIFLNPHYYQIGHNENGLNAAENMYYLLYGDPEISVTQTADRNSYEDGSSITYTIVVRENSSASTATNIVVDETFSRGVQDLKVSTSKGSVTNVNDVGASGGYGSFEVAVGSLAPGTFATITVEATLASNSGLALTPGYQLSNYAIVTYATNQYTDGDNYLTVDSNKAVVTIEDHTYGTPTFTWGDDYSCKATFTCTGCGEQVTLDCNVTSSVTQEPTCSRTGTRMYTATVYDPITGEGYTSQKSETIPMTRHTYDSAPTFVWSDDYTSCEAIFKCSVCGEELKVQCDVSSSVTKEPTCTQEGTETVIATVTNPETGEEYSDGQDVTLPKTEHIFSGDEADLTWTWSDDHMSATASFVCEECHETITVEAVVTDSEDPCTCTNDGAYIYTAVVEINGETYSDVYRERIPAMGHDLTATFDWSEDDGQVSCVAHVTCTRGDLNEDVDCILTEVSHEDATCTKDGTTTFIATAGIDGQTLTSGEYTAVTEKATGHTYGVPSFTWSNGYSSCTATFTCVHGDDSFTESCTITSTEVAPLCEVEGERTYTATVRNGGETYTDSRSESISALGHSWETTVYAPTCGEDGYTIYTCTRCGDSYIADYVPATGDHTWGNGVVVTPPACTTEGELLLTCTVCGATRTEPISALGHSFEGNITWNDGTGDDKKATIEITCANGCGYDKTYDCSVSHQVVEEQTCETVGRTEYTAYFSGEEGEYTSRIVVADIPADDHRYTYDLYSFTFTDENGTTWQYGQDDSKFVWNESVTCSCVFTCKVCGKVFPVNCDIHVVSGYTQELRYATDFVVYANGTRLLNVRTMDGHVVSVDMSPQTLTGAEVGDMTATEANAELGTILSEETIDELDKGLTLEEAVLEAEAVAAAEPSSEATIQNNPAGASNADSKSGSGTGTEKTEGAKTGDNVWLIAGLFITGLAGLAEALNLSLRKCKEN